MRIFYALVLVWVGMVFPVQAVTISAVGDIMLDRGIRGQIATYGPDFPFEKIRGKLTSNIVLGNLEGTITPQLSIATDSYLRFTFDPSVAPALRQVGFTHLSIANNHALDFGSVGLQQTRLILSTNGLQPFGDPKNKNGYAATQIIDGQRVTVIGYHGFHSGLLRTLVEIRRAKQLDSTVIVMAHWGAEYSPGVREIQRNTAHAFIRAGAELVLGSHPHVIQPFEIYRGKFIAYSLGNFVFDQDWAAETQSSILLQARLGPSPEIQIVPLTIQNGQPSLAAAPERQRILNNLAANSLVSKNHRRQIKSGILQKL